MSPRSRPATASARARTTPARPVRARPWFTLHAGSGLDPAFARRLERLGLVLVGALTVLLLVMVLGPHRVGDYFTETDFYGGYALGARALQHGHIDPARYGVVGPGYEVALALLGFLLRDLFFTAELISVVSVAAGVWLWFRLLCRRADPRLALAGLLFMATNGTLFRYGYSATTDGLAFALQALALWLLLTQSRPRSALLAGVCAALAFLTRYSAAYLLPAGLVALLARGTLQRRWGIATLLFAAGFAAPLVPWVLYSLAHGGTLALQLHHNIAYDVFARAQGIVWDDYQKTLQPRFHSLWDVIAYDPGAVGRRELFNLWDHLRLDGTVLLGGPVAAAAGVGLLLTASDGTLRKLWPLWVAGVLAFLILVPSFYAERYSLPLLPFYATLAGALFTSPRFAMVIRRGPQPWLKPALAVLPLAFAVQSSTRLQARVIDQLPVELLPPARALKTLARPGDKLIARKPHLSYLANLEALAFPFTTTLPELAAYAHAKSARWLFYSWPEAEMRPAYFFLLDTSGVVPGLVPRSVSPGRPAVLYEIGPEFGKAPDWLANDTLLTYHTARARLMVDPRDGRGNYALGFIERTRGQLAEARTHLERAARAQPKDLPTALLLGEVYLLSNDASRAMDAFQQALSLDPGSVPARVGLGWAALAARRPADAARLWRGVIGLTRDDATLERMVDLYESVGDPASAAEASAALARLRATP